MKNYKIISLVLLFVLGLGVSNTFAANYNEIDCSSDSDFTANECNQCFDGGEKLEGDNIGAMTDLWVNDSNVSKLIYKEEQDMPKMVNLNSSKVTWQDIPSSEGFWKYTSELDSRYNEDEDGYILGSGEKVVWLQSTVGYAYRLEKNEVPKGDKLGMLVYTIITHNITDGIVGDDEQHRECVLFKSGENTTTVTPETPTTTVTPTGATVAATGPEHILLVFLAMILGVGYFKIRRKA